MISVRSYTDEINVVSNVKSQFAIDKTNANFCSLITTFYSTRRSVNQLFKFIVPTLLLASN